MKSPLVLVPGIQGRWEWMRPAVQALERTHDVRTFSLNDVTPLGASGDGLNRFFDRWHRRIDHLVEHVQPFPLIGVSFGGLIALTYAAARPDRVSHLVLVSTPSPRFRLDRTQTAYLQRPTLSLPLFGLRAAGRLAPEVRAGLPTWVARSRFAASYLATSLLRPASPRLMAAWAREWMGTDLSGVCGSVRTPTLVLTGEPELDRVVPVSSSLEYLELVPGAVHETLKSTGHLGFLMKPDAFAGIVSNFLSTPLRT
jgi:pimeloyl-ACP methyl ester carboxylesterase